MRRRAPIGSLRIRTGRPGLTAMVVLAALLLRAYVPIGFMPASGLPFRVEFCPAYGVPGTPHAHHHHAAGHADFSECPFGSSPAPGPVTDPIDFSPPAAAAPPVRIPAATTPTEANLRRTQQPRAPPTPA